MKTKTLTFAHPTYQTGHNTIYTDYTPPQSVIDALLKVGPIGIFPVRDWIIRVEPYASNIATFTIVCEGQPLVKCYASYITDPDKAEAASRQTLSALKDAGSRLEVIPANAAVVAGLPPIRGPFLMVALKLSIMLVPAAVRMLGDAERCIYWHLHQFYGE